MQSKQFFSLSTLFGFGLALTSLACGSAGPSASAAPATPYVVVHGAWQGAADWDEVATQLRSKGATVTVVELPAHGVDQTPITDASFAAYTEKVEGVIDGMSGPVILVGHSFGGMVISAVAEARVAKIQKLIYVAAYVPKDGDSLLTLAQTDADSHLAPPTLVVDQSAGTADVAADKRQDVFCAECTPSELAGLNARYRTEPLAPLATPVHLTAENWGRVPKYYVYTKNDHAVSYSLQRSMTANSPFVATAALDTGHLPFVSNPALMVSTLLGF